MTGRGQAASNWVALLRFLLCRIDRFIWITVPSVVHGLPEQMDFGVHYHFFKCKDISWYTVSLGSMFSSHLLFTARFGCSLVEYTLLGSEYYLIFPTWYTQTCRGRCLLELQSIHWERQRVSTKLQIFPWCSSLKLFLLAMKSTRLSYDGTHGRWFP